jgi:hypothetical protein
MAPGSGDFSAVEVNVAHNATEVSVVFNGSAVSTSTGAAAVVPSTIHLGTRQGSSLALNGHIKQVLHVPRKVSDGDLPTFGVAA